ncbi:MAG: lipopolysaccharide biosynthesis protein [Bacteroidota bacterium]
MGEIFKQSAKGSIYIYTGVVIGFITTGVLYPRLLTTQEIGLINVLISYSVILAQLGGLGMQQVITRLFPYFRDEKQQHHGFLALVLLITAAGFVLVAFIYWLFKDMILQMGKQQSGMLNHYIDLIIPLLLFHMLFVLLDNYYKVLYNAVKGTYYQEVVKRVFVLVAILGYYFHVLEFQGFVLFYVLAAAIPFLGLFWSLKQSKQLFLKTDFPFITPPMRKEIADVGMFGLLAGTSGIFVLHIDKIMVLNLTNSLGDTGVYAIAFFFGSLVQKPAKALSKVSSVYISEAWKANRLREINDLYKKSAVNQTLIGLFLLVGLVVNLDNIFEFLSEDYSEGRAVIIFIALAYLIDMGAGVNGTIINTSRYYRWQMYLILILLVSVVLFNWLLIPLWGIMGAAVATLISKFLFNLSKFVFIYWKWKLQPFNFSFVKIILIGAMAFLAGWLLPVLDNYIWDLLYRSALVTLVYGIFVLWLRPSEDVEYWRKKLFSNK